jgi:hypothetical protein
MEMAVQVSTCALGLLVFVYLARVMWGGYTLTSDMLVGLASAAAVVLPLSMLTARWLAKSGKTRGRVPPSSDAGSASADAGAGGGAAGGGRVAMTIAGVFWGYMGETTHQAQRQRYAGGSLSAVGALVLALAARRERSVASAQVQSAVATVLLAYIAVMQLHGLGKMVVSVVILALSKVLGGACGKASVFGFLADQWARVTFLVGTMLLAGTLVALAHLSAWGSLLVFNDPSVLAVAGCMTAVAWLLVAWSVGGNITTPKTYTAVSEGDKPSAPSSPLTGTWEALDLALILSAVCIQLGDTPRREAEHGSTRSVVMFSVVLAAALQLCLRVLLGPGGLLSFVWDRKVSGKSTRMPMLEGVCFFLTSAISSVTLVVGLLGALRYVHLQSANVGSGILFVAMSALAVVTAAVAMALLFTNGVELRFHVYQRLYASLMTLAFSTVAAWAILWSVNSVQGLVVAHSLLLISGFFVMGAVPWREDAFKRDE